MYEYKVDYDISIYTLFLNAYFFMVCLDKPYYNRHNQLSYPVKAISFNTPLKYDFKCLIVATREKKDMIIRFLFVFKGFRCFF